MVVVQLSTGLELAFPPQQVEGLETAAARRPGRDRDRSAGLWAALPELDADLYLPALLEGLLGSKSWAAARMGQEGGKAQTPAKQAASRANGRLGGRPRKVA